ncbi:MAG: protein kinase, partial [Gemmatimonadota bacterium]
MATVYLAEDLKHERKVALKVLHPDLAATIGVDRFLSEIKVTANLQHPNILGLFDSGIADGQAYYVMPFVEGESLRDRLNREKQLPVADALRIATGVAAALEYAHAHGVIHRDIKPENILLQSGQPVVADFGIALAVQQAGGQRLTQTGMSLGTPQYMSPEQAMGERSLDARTDIYALGVITYEMLAGEPPFTGPNTQAIVARVLTDKPRPLSQLRETVSPQIEGAVHQAMQKLPADRFATADQFAEALRAGGATTSQRAAGSTTLSASRTAPQRRGLLAAAIGVVALLCGAYFLGRRSGHGPEIATEWRGELLGGPVIAMRPTVSRDGQFVAFQAMVDGETQLGVLKPGTGDWKVLTNDLTHGSVTSATWSRDNGTIYFDRFRDVPNGIYSISPLGGEERLVLANAGEPDILPDGSLLAAVINSDRNDQLVHFWPESGRLDTLPAIGTLTANSSFFRSFPNGREAVFFGRPATTKDSADHLYAIDLTSKAIRRLAPTFFSFVSTIAVTPDNKWVYVATSSVPVTRIVAIASDGSSRAQVLTVLPNPTYGLDVGTDGSIYFDQFTRPIEMIHHAPASHQFETERVATGIRDQLALPGNRVLVAVKTGGRSRVVVLAKGKQPVPFMAT